MSAGMAAAEPIDVAACTTAVFKFIARCRSVLVAFMRPKDVKIGKNGIRASKRQVSLVPVNTRLPCARSLRTDIAHVSDGSLA